jgi:hypothetical protein
MLCKFGDLLGGIRYSKEATLAGGLCFVGKRTEFTGWEKVLCTKGTALAAEVLLFAAVSERLSVRDDRKACLRG